MSKSVLDFQGHLFHLNCTPKFFAADYFLKAWKEGNMCFPMHYCSVPVQGTVSLIMKVIAVEGGASKGVSNESWSNHSHCPPFPFLKQV